MTANYQHMTDNDLRGMVRRLWPEAAVEGWPRDLLVWYLSQMDGLGSIDRDYQGRIADAERNQQAVLDDILHDYTEAREQFVRDVERSLAELWIAWDGGNNVRNT